MVGARRGCARCGVSPPTRASSDPACADAAVAPIGQTPIEIQRCGVEGRPLGPPDRQRVRIRGGDEVDIVLPHGAHENADMGGGATEHEVAGAEHCLDEAHRAIDKAPSLSMFRLSRTCKPGASKILPPLAARSLGTPFASSRLATSGRRRATLWQSSAGAQQHWSRSRA